MDGGDMGEAGCTCKCMECAEKMDCSICSHKMSEEGCTCAGCKCNDVPAAPTEPAM